ncbi:uncharacterized protein LOC6565379 [Drosophila grimshawi]|uniref:GH12125 n=1 Tax=Drosophila grimshawi TaxID=7222 RepID=B4JK36_DROGR|nr:uncharacterized protein LOC6565379 [Drosophila grimshawi]EDV99938.1 GH12125 [Drosophila grimshawi]
MQHLIIVCGILLLMVQCQAALTAIDLLPAPDTGQLTTLAEALGQVLQHSEMSQRQTLYIHMQFSATSSHPQLLELLARVLDILPATASQTRCLFEQRPMEYRPYVHAVLLLVDDIRALRTVYRKLHATSDLSLTLIYMMRPQPTAAMKLLWQRSVLNVAILVVEEQQQRVMMLSFYPYSATHGCRVIKASIVNQYVAAVGRWANDDFFPDKLSNFFGCTLTCATWPDMPYLVRQPNGQFVGIEGELLQFMAANLNFSIGIYWLNNSQVRDTFNESGWVFDQIFANAEYALGGFHYKPNEGTDMPYSQSKYYFMSHIMLITNLPSAYSPYEKLAFPFHPLLWQAICLVLALGCLSLWLLQRFWKHLPHHPYYQFLVLTMGGNLLSRELPLRNSFRLLFVTWLLWSWVMRSAYQSGMYQLLRQDKQRHPPQTIAEVIEQRYTIQMVEGNGDRWLASLPELRTQQLRQLTASELHSFAGLAESSGSNQRLAIITPYEYFGYFRKVHEMSRRLHLVRERIFTQQLAFNVRRHSHLIGVLNKQIMLAHSHGFLEHWTRKYVSAVDASDESTERISAIPTYGGTTSTTQVSNDDDNNTDTNTNTITDMDANANDDEEEDEAPAEALRVLSFKELAALFYLTVWSMLFAILVFGLELLLHK